MEGVQGRGVFARAVYACADNAPKFCMVLMQVTFTFS